MALKTILTSQADFTGEYKQTDKTKAIWRLNETDTALRPDEIKEAGAYAVSEPTGFPRFAVDGLDESNTVFKQKFDGTDADLTLDGATIYSDEDNDTNITMFNGKALEFSAGRAWLPGLPSSMGPNKTVSLWIRVSPLDLDGLNWHVIATQRTAGNAGYHISIYDNVFVIRAYNSARQMVINTDLGLWSIPTDEWLLLSINHSNTQWEVTINGFRRASGYLTHPIVDLGQDWELGRMGNIYKFNGLIGEMWAFDDRLMAAHIRPYYLNAEVRKNLLPTDVQLEKIGTWSDLEYNTEDQAGQAIYTDTAGTQVNYTFKGNQIIWRTRTGPNLGIAEIYIDETLIEEIDLYTQTTEYQVPVFTSEQLSAGTHVLSIRWTGRNNGLSSGSRIVHNAVEIQPDYSKAKDSSGNGNDLSIINVKAGGAKFDTSWFGNQLRFNYVDPPIEKTHLRAFNDGSLFQNVGKRLTVGGWIVPTAYGATQTFVPLFSTREGPGEPIIYLALQAGRINVRLYDQDGVEIYNEIETQMDPVTAFLNQYVGVEVDTVNKTVTVVHGTRENETFYKGAAKPYTGTLNNSTDADIVIGMLADNYWFSGWIDDWMYETNSNTTADDLEEYYWSSLVANGGYANAEVDGITLSGSVILKETAGAYATSGDLLTPAQNLGNGIQGTGKVQIVGDYQSGVTAIHNIQTRTTDQIANPIWSDWENTTSDGEILSPNRTFMQIKVTLETADTSKTPEIMEIQIHEIVKAPYERLGYSRPVILTQLDEREAVLENAYNIIITEEVNGAQYVNFDIPFKDGKRQTIENEKKVQFTNDIYRLRTVTDNKDESGKTITSVYAEANFYDLAFSDPIEPVEYVEVGPTGPMLHALKKTDWNLGRVTVNAVRTWEANEKNTLLFLRKVQELWGGDLVFNNGAKTVDLLAVAGDDTGVVFAYRKNMKSIQKVVDTKELITKLFVYGKEGLSIEDANGGLPYITDYSHTIETRALKIENNSFTNPYQLKEWADERLAELSQPRVSYVINIMDLSTLTGWEHETFKLGDQVTVDDQEMGIKVKTRIIRREYNAQEPWKTVIELSTKLRELGDETARWKQDSGVLEDAEYVKTQDISKLMVFNYLLNSRGDDGFQYWQNAGFELDNTSGFSGNASFKVDGAYGQTKSLLQTIHPANRDAYTVSAKISTENLQKGPAGRVGIEVKVYYEDGSDEIKFIPL